MALPGRLIPPKRTAMGFTPEPSLSVRQLRSGVNIDKRAPSVSFKDFAVPEVLQYNAWVCRYYNTPVDPSKVTLVKSTVMKC